MDRCNVHLQSEHPRVSLTSYSRGLAAHEGRKPRRFPFSHLRAYPLSLGAFAGRATNRVFSVVLPSPYTPGIQIRRLPSSIENNIPNAQIESHKIG